MNGSVGLRLLRKMRLETAVLLSALIKCMRVRADLVAGPVALIVKINGRGNLSMERPDLYQISVAVVQSQELTIIKDAVLF